ncbi:site-specific DNA-methyltransferase [Xanthomonas campestris]|uniref:site-specific DNA-methyltransferase n=1 Tax=Xanthomonas campestris TaxID=339 RepID=UPI0023787F6C|nr:site-specific DNA-methyltransferase [Xanthomonas campestris]WDK30857.1 site-specific DNA-methyltransferase [Xanthomonas campestris]
MDKLEMHSANAANANIERIREIFPGCVTEARAEDGSIKLAVDFDQLRQELSCSLVEGPQERYHLDWPGKREALVAANAPIAKALRPVRDESVGFDITKNLFIEGDNLDALKLLQDTYLGRVKMIYIDPPYNTGGDFIYEDDFSERSEDYLYRSSQTDDKGSQLVANTAANGRFHSDWLSMIFPRLRLAKNLLADTGVLFISIDDSEMQALKLVCDEIFGQANFYCSFVWKRRSGSMDSTDNTSVDHEYVLCYGKNKGKLNGILRTYGGYSNPDDDPRGDWKADNLSAGKAGGDVYYPIRDPETGNEFLPPAGRYWPYSRKTMAEKISEGRVIFPASASGRPMLKRFKKEAKFDTVPVSTWIVSRDEFRISNSIVGPSNTVATKELQEIFGAKIFPHPKSVRLITSLASQCNLENDDIILDFFAGSASTAHAVMKMNAEDGGSRRFIMVQLPELCAENSEAFKMGFKNIAEVSKERIRRASKEFSDDLTSGGVDVGFRVLKIDSSNMADVFYAPDALDKASLDLFVDNIKPDRTAEDLLFQVMLDWGVDLTLPIEKKVIQGKDVFFVDGDALAACFDAQGGIDEAFVKELANYKPLRVVFRDAGFKDSAVKINVEQIFKLLSPITEVKSI